MPFFAPQNDAVKASRHSLSVCGNAAESGANPAVAKTYATTAWCRRLEAHRFTKQMAALSRQGVPSYKTPSRFVDE